MVCMACSVSACMDGSDWERGTALATERDGEILEGETESKKGTYGSYSYSTIQNLQCTVQATAERLETSRREPVLGRDVPDNVKDQLGLGRCCSKARAAMVEDGTAAPCASLTARLSRERAAVASCLSALSGSVRSSIPACATASAVHSSNSTSGMSTSLHVAASSATASLRRTFMIFGRAACRIAGRNSLRTIREVSTFERYIATCGVPARASSVLTVPQQASASEEAR